MAYRHHLAISLLLCRDSQSSELFLVLKMDIVAIKKSASIRILHNF